MSYVIHQIHITQISPASYHQEQTARVNILHVTCVTLLSSHINYELTESQSPCDKCTVCFPQIRDIVIQEAS